MKRIGVYLLIFALLSTDNIVKEFLKTPLLVNHFLVHQQKDPSIGFIRFMSMHYFGKDLQDNDWSQDMKLPFKKISGSSHHTLFQLPGLITDQEQREAYLPGHDPVYTEEYIQNLAHNKLYRPPQSLSV